MRQFIAKSVEEVNGRDVSIMLETDRAIATGLLRPDLSKAVLATSHQAVHTCPVCGSIVTCGWRSFRMNDKFVQNGIVYRAPQFYHHISEHRCSSGPCAHVSTRSYVSLDKDGTCAICNPKPDEPERSINILRDEKKLDGTPREMSVAVGPDGEHYVHMHGSDLIPDPEPPALPDDFDRLISRFAQRDFLGCAELGAKLSQTRHSVEVLQLTLISMQRLGWFDVAERVGEMALHGSGGHPLIAALFNLTLGRINLAEAMKTARGPGDECRIRFYAAAHLLTTGKPDEARMLLRVCRQSNAASMEWQLASFEEEWDSRGYSPDDSERVHFETWVAEEMQMAMLHHARGERKLALDAARRAIAIGKEHLGSDRPQHVEALGLLGGLLSDGGRYKEAIVFCVEAVERAKVVFGDADSRYAQANNNLAATYQRLGKFVEAENAYNTSIAGL